jgi:hypothetical protein
MRFARWINGLSAFLADLRFVLRLLRRQSQACPGCAQGGMGDRPLSRVSSPAMVTRLGMVTRSHDRVMPAGTPITVI